MILKFIDSKYPYFKKCSNILTCLFTNTIYFRSFNNLNRERLRSRILYLFCNKLYVLQVFAYKVQFSVLDTVFFLSQTPF